MSAGVSADLSEVIKDRRHAAEDLHTSVFM